MVLAVLVVVVVVMVHGGHDRNFAISIPVFVLVEVAAVQVKLVGLFVVSVPSRSSTVCNSLGATNTDSIMLILVSFSFLDASGMTAVRSASLFSQWHC